MKAIERNIELSGFVPGCPSGIAEIGNDGKVLFISESFYDVLQSPRAERMPLHLEEHFGSCLDHISLALKELSAVSGAMLSFSFNCSVKSATDASSDIHRIICTLTRKNAESVLISVSDFTEAVSLREQLDKVQSGLSYRDAWLETTKGLLHDIGNAVSGMSLLATQMTNEDGGEESDCLLQLQSYVSLHRTELEKALGGDNYLALSRMLNILKDSWENRRGALRANLNMVMHSVAHIGELIYLHRTYSSSEDSEKEPIDLKRVVMDSLLILYSQLDKRKVKVKFDENAAGVLIRGNRAPLLSMFLNIIKNAYESIDLREDQTGEKLISISLTCPDSTIVSVRIADNGMGFSPEQESHLFEKSFSTKKRSSGLGLYSCRRIVADHGGKIWMRSEGAGLGASVFIEFPSLRLAT